MERVIFNVIPKKRIRITDISKYLDTSESLTENTVNLHSLFENYINLPLECDGLSKVLAYILSKNKIKYIHYFGTLIDKKTKDSIYHEWIESAGFIIDYRARMWMGNSAPHGVFKYKNSMSVIYEKEGYYRRPISDVVFSMLTM